MATCDAFVLRGYSGCVLFRIQLHICLFVVGAVCCYKAARGQEGDGGGRGYPNPQSVGLAHLYPPPFTPAVNVFGDEMGRATGIHSPRCSLGAFPAGSSACAVWRFLTTPRRMAWTPCGSVRARWCTRETPPGGHSCHATPRVCEVGGLRVDRLIICPPFLLFGW